MSKMNLKITAAVLIMLSFGGGYYLGMKTKKTHFPALFSSSFLNQSSKNEVYSIAGSIKKIGNNFLIVAPDKKGEADKKITISKDTKFSLNNKPRTGLSFGFGFGEANKEKPENGQKKETGQEKTVDFSSLKVGDKIIADAAENIKDKTEFTAERITILQPQKEEQPGK